MIIIPCPDPELRTLEQIFKHYSPYFYSGRDVSDLLEKDVRRWAQALRKKQRQNCGKRLRDLACRWDEIGLVESTPLVRI